MIRGFIYGTVLVLAAGGVCLSAPEPAVVQGPGDWTVDISFKHPEQFWWQPGRGSKPRLFWYTIMTLTNRTNSDVDFYPKCELMTDSFEVIEAGRFTPKGVFEQIKRRHQSKYPFLGCLEEAGNKILQGEDNTKDIAIIWPDFETKAKNIRLFISGLSNETVVMEHPTAKDAAGEPAKIYLRKTLELSYGVKGDPALRSYIKLNYKGKRWVMR
ncbi:MAG: hypothetical protein ACYS4W_10460 [Planctomycetota bacterium]|jgi:hypothetical protein